MWELTVGISVSLLSGCTCGTAQEWGDEHDTQAEFATSGEKSFKEKIGDCVYRTAETCGLISNPWNAEVMQLCVGVR